MDPYKETVFVYYNDRNNHEQQAMEEDYVAEDLVETSDSEYQDSEDFQFENMEQEDIVLSEDSSGQSDQGLDSTVRERGSFDQWENQVSNPPRPSLRKPRISPNHSPPGSPTSPQLSSFSLARSPVPLTRGLLQDLNQISETESQVVSNSKNNVPAAGPSQQGPDNLQAVGNFQRKLDLYNFLKVLPEPDPDTAPELSPSKVPGDHSLPEPRSLRDTPRVNYRDLHRGKY